MSERFNNHNGIIKYKNFYPSIHKNALIAKNCIITGDVEIAENVGIWYFCVIDVIDIARRSISLCLLKSLDNVDTITSHDYYSCR